MRMHYQMAHIMKIPHDKSIDIFYTNLINYFIKTLIVMGDRFKKIRVIGKGGFGKVYEAIDLHNGETVALKEMYGQYISWE